jgi:choline dehydrogenase
VTGSAPYATFMTAHDVFGSNMSAAATQTKALLHQWAAQIASQENNGVDVKAIETVLAIQHDLIFNKNVTIGEVITSAYGSNLFSAFWALLPFSRGSVHLTSSSESDVNSPTIDPAFLQINFDLEMQIAVGKLTQKYYSTNPIKHLVVANLAPGTSVLPIPASDDQWTSYVKEDCKLCPLSTPMLLARVTDDILQLLPTLIP